MLLGAVGCAQQNDPVLIGALSWNMTIDEAMASLGETVQRIDDSDPAIGSATMLTVEGAFIFGAETVYTQLLFWNGEMMSISFYYNEAAVPNEDALIGAVSAVCGPATVFDENTLAPADVFGDRKTLCHWNGIEGTAIALIRATDAEKYIPYTLSFTNNAIFEKMYASFEASE